MAVVERFIRTVAFAVRLHDDFFRQGFLSGQTKVFLSGSGVTAVENPSRYHVFTDLIGTAFTVRVENAYYFNQEVSVSIPALDPRNPVVSVTMKPKYLYPFPAGSTLIRGAAVGPGGTPVEGAAISVVGSSVTNKSEQDGRFVLYFGPLTEDNIAVTGTRRYVKIGVSTTLQIRVVHPSYAPKTVTIGTVEEATTKLLTTPITLSP